MDPDVLEFAQVVFVIVGSLAALAGVRLAYRFLNRLISRMSPEKPAPRIDDERIARIEQSVDAIAIEVERISESQRFITKVLGERSRSSGDLNA